MSRIDNLVIPPPNALEMHNGQSCSKSDFKVTCNSADVILNEIGIVQLQRGQNEEALKSFSEAIKQNQGSRSNIVTAGAECDFSMAATTNNGDNNQIHCSTIEESFLCMYQQHDFDEGMHVYNETLHTKDISSADLRHNMLLYNTGQAYIRCKEYDKARRKFEQSLVLLAKCREGDTTTLNMMKLKHNIGYCYYRLGKNKLSLEFYRGSLPHTGQQGLTELNMAALYNCFAIVLLHDTPNDRSRSLELMQLSLSIHRMHAGNLKQEATFLNNLGRIHFLREEYGQALMNFSQALNIRRRLLGQFSVDLGATLYNTALTYHKRGNLDQALVCYEELLFIVKNMLGCDNNGVRIAHMLMARLCFELGHQERGNFLFGQVLQAQQDTAGFESSFLDLASVMGNQIDSLPLNIQGNNCQTAVTNYFIERLENAKRAIEMNRHQGIESLISSAHSCRDQGDFRSALEKYKEAYKQQLGLHGSLSVDAVSTLSCIGLMHFYLEDFNAALECYKDALQYRCMHYGSNAHPDIATTLSSIGHVFFKLGHFQAAEDAFLESVKMRKQLEDLDGPVVANLWYNLASVAQEKGDDSRAIRYYSESIRLEKSMLESDQTEVAVTLQDMGKLYERCCDLDNAMNCFIEALATLRSSRLDTNSNSANLCKLLCRMGKIHLSNSNIGEMMKCLEEAGSRGLDDSMQEFHELATTIETYYELISMRIRHPECAKAA